MRYDLCNAIPPPIPTPTSSQVGRWCGVRGGGCGLGCQPIVGMRVLLLLAWHLSVLRCGTRGYRILWESRRRRQFALAAQVFGMGNSAHIRV